MNEIVLNEDMGNVFRICNSNYYNVSQTIESQLTYIFDSNQ